MKAPPVLLLAGSSPVVAYLRASMMVVLPEPFQPTIRVSGAVKMMVSPFSGPNERMLWG